MELLFCQFNANILKAFLRCIYVVRLYFFLSFEEHLFHLQYRFGMSSSIR
nr:MAG TPA: hypothetical protein [Caudoviricetes sp.]